MWAKFYWLSVTLHVVTLGWHPKPTESTCLTQQLPFTEMLVYNISLICSMGLSTHLASVTHLYIWHILFTRMAFCKEQSVLLVSIFALSGAYMLTLMHNGWCDLLFFKHYFLSIQYIKNTVSVRSSKSPPKLHLLDQIWSHQVATAAMPDLEGSKL